MHPDINGFVSDMFYDGRLEPEAHLQTQRIEPPERLSTARVLAGSHRPTFGARNESPEDGRRRDLATLIDGGAIGSTQTVDTTDRLDDIIMVAPYNAHVGEINRRCRQRRAGRDGRQVPGTGRRRRIYSMASLEPDYAPRGMDFLYSRNRLNVAVVTGPRVASWWRAPP